MHKAVPILALAALLAGCGGSDRPEPTPTATRTAAAAANDPLGDYSEGVRKYYAGASPEAADDPNADAEVKYFQPPVPAEARLGEKITLTGANIGVKVNVTPTDIKTVQADGKDYTNTRVDVGAKLTGCLLFPAGENAERLQLALETIPTEAGGIWNLNAG